jgi:lysophospholipase L1-like esterase
MLRSTIGRLVGLGLVLVGVASLPVGCGQSPGQGATGSGGAGGTATGGSGGSGGLPGTGGVMGTGGAAGGGGTTTMVGTVGTGGATSSGGVTSRPDASDDVGDTSPADARQDASPKDLSPRDTLGTGGATIGGTGGSGSGGRVGTGGSGTGGAGTGGGGVGGGTANITLWLAGDSTVANGSTPCPTGWGKSFQSLFNAKVTVVNSAQGGRSVQTWLYDVGTTKGTDGECVLNSTTYLTAWSNMLTNMETGDYLFIQFGINDGDSSCNRHVGTALFQTYYGMMAQAARDRGAYPIFVTPVSSISCSGSKAVGTRGGYATATEQAGVTYGVPVIDLEQLSVALYTSLGFCPLPGPDNATTFASGEIGAFFCEDHTHFEAAGATQIAGLVARALRDQGIGLSAYLK